MKSFQIIILVSLAVLSIVMGWEVLQMVFILVPGTAILVHGVIYAVYKMTVFRSFRSAITSFFWKVPMALGFSLIVVLSIGVIAAIVMSLRGFVPPSESWLYVTLGFVVGVMGVVGGIKKSKIINHQSSIRPNDQSVPPKELISE